MNAREHYQEAERMVAQAHATLALAAANGALLPDLEDVLPPVVDR